MAKKVPVTVFVDPDVETTLTIKAFAAGLARAPAQDAAGQGLPDQVTGNVTGTGVGAPNPDVDGSVDYQ
jgi:hypothetical protein